MRFIKIPKKKRGEYREICVPHKKLKHELRDILVSLENVLKNLERNGNINKNIIHGFVSERSPVTNAKPHIGYKYTLSMDLANFFDNVKPEHVKNIISKEIIDKVFINGSPKQGLPTSPLVCNIAATKMDSSIIKFLKKKNLNVVYTRYADDLSFSFNDKQYYILLKDHIKQIVNKTGFKINESKTRLQSSKFGNREVTGVMVGENGISVSRKFKRKMRAAKHQNNKSSFAGMEEWSKLKTPKSKEEKTNFQEETYKTLVENNRAKPNHFTIRQLKEIREDDFLITNDLAYMWGMTDLATDWTSCYKRNGSNCNAPIFISYFDSYVGLLLSKEKVNYFGVCRNKIRARCIIYNTKEGERVAGQFYGSSLHNREKLKDFLKKNGVKIVYPKMNLKNNQVKGYAPSNINKTALYFGKKVSVKLKNKTKSWVKIKL